VLSTGNGSGRSGAIQRRLGLYGAAGGKAGKRKKKSTFGSGASAGGRYGRGY
jgi:hypothetical protein